MADSLTAAVSDRICRHMNEDHSEAVLLYAQVFGRQSDAVSARLESIDSAGMDLIVEARGESQPIRIEFDHALRDSEDAHQTLIAMVKQARGSVS